MRIHFYLTVYLLIYFICGITTMCSASGENWGPFRGMTINAEFASEKAINDFSKTGGNLLRVSFGNVPLMQKTPPYQYNENSFVMLDKIIQSCEKYGIRVVIDPHTTPGTKLSYTTLPKDELWKDYFYHDLLISLWAKISERYANRGEVIAGYDILNEPTLPVCSPEQGPGSWNELAHKIIEVIRKNDNTHFVIVEPIVCYLGGKKVSRLEGLNYLVDLNDPRVVYSPHFYEPIDFTHQGVFGKEEGVKYPSVIKGEYWNKSKIKSALKVVREFQVRYSVPIFIGEFSAVRWAGKDGNQYIHDCIDNFEEYGWSWAYHSYRSAQMWDPEMSDIYKHDLTRNSDSQRMTIIKNYFNKNIPVVQQ